MEPADHEMYRAAIHGDTEAFEMVIRKMSRPLFAVAFGALQNREEAEDADRMRSSMHGNRAGRCVIPEKFPAWIAMIVRNRAHDILMRKVTSTGSLDCVRDDWFGERLGCCSNDLTIVK